MQCGVVANTPSGIAAFILAAQAHHTSTKIISRLLTPMRFEGLMDSNAAWKAAKPAAVAYMASFDFDGMAPVQALRTVLLRTSAPSSTRAVSFLLRMTSARYFRTAVEAHPHGPLAAYFPDLDAVYLLMYGCFILNNDVHSKALKPGMKMTRERFIANHRGTPGLENVSTELLAAAYDDIKAQPLPLKGWDGESARAAAALPSFLTSVACSVRHSASSFIARLFA